MNVWSLVIAYYVGINGNHIDKVYEFSVPAVSHEQCLIAAEEIKQSIGRSVALPARAEIDVRCSQP